MKRTLIACGWLVTGDSQLGSFRNGELLLAGDHIEAVGRNLGATADETVDASDKIVLPGLVNAHMHTWQTGLRGIAGDWMTAQYMQNIHGNLGTRYTPEDNYLGNLIGALAQIDGGVTTLVDWCHNITSLEHAERSIDGLADSGIRAVFAHGTAKPPTRPGELPFTHVPHPRERIEALRTGRLAADDGLITLAMAILGPDYSTWEVIEHDIRLAREFGLVTTAHTRARQESITPDGYRRMAAAGLLGPDHNVVHATTYTDEELRIIIDSGASITSTAQVELRQHVGDTVVARVRAVGGLPSLGPDVEPFVSAHMWREMQAALLFVRGHVVKQNAALGNSSFKTMPVAAIEALRWATIGGARAFGIEKRIGTLSPGKKADLIMLRAGDLNLAPVHDPLLSAVELAHAGNVDTVVIDGVVRKQAGRMLFPADVLQRRMTELTESAARIMHEGGIAAPALN